MKVKKNRVYRHFKGDYYIVVDTAIDSETGETVVLYRSLYGEGVMFVRTCASFLSAVDHEKYPEVEQKYKFELQEIESKRRKWEESK